MSVTFVKHEGSRLHAADRCYELYRIYPGGKEWLCGYFRGKEDYEIELARCQNEEAGPDEYVIKEVPSAGIPEYKIHDIIKERQRRNKEARQRAIVAKKWAEESKRLHEKWEREEREWREKHPNQQRRLIDRRFPPLFGCHELPPFGTTPEGLHQALRFLYPDSTQKFVEATDFAKTIKPRRRKK